MNQPCQKCDKLLGLLKTARELIQRAIDWEHSDWLYRDGSLDLLDKAIAEADAAVPEEDGA